ncbi:hypothetical protein TSOC_004025 [Tetrabaena socialis]|uniref:Uncharacterized protein n=1 Tax=Tetrabaena socialis TaxID=47790 RepID=A0A2J8AA12_9CHLO|nr:hypothetical protein TSOC_004025 [Tetrabaena socialis]|eukprot:PNH09368.1 hypothetical protein TSOC_004025 [Tetrabaena socialis]
MERFEVMPELRVLDDAELRRRSPLLELFGRCKRVDLGSLCLEADVSVEAAQQLLHLLSGVRLLRVRLFADFTMIIDVQLGGPRPAPPACASTEGGPATGLSAVGGQCGCASTLGSPTPSPSPLPTPTDLLRVAVQRWAESGQGSLTGARVLLRGPVVAGLVGSPEDLTAWVRRLAQQAGVEAADQTYDGSNTQQRLQCFRAVPRAGAVLLQCRSEEAASAVAAAVRAAAAAAVAAQVPAATAAVEAEVPAAAAVEVAAPAASMGAEAAAEVAVEAAATAAAGLEASVSGAPLEVVLLPGSDHDPIDGLGFWASQVAQEVLEGLNGADAWGEQERMGCVLQLWAEVMDLPGWFLF